MGRVFACSDLHGCIGLFGQILEFLQPDDTVYFLGDAGDRGMHGWEMIKMIMIDERFIYLKGNHEDMLVAAAKDYFKYRAYTHNYNLLRSNGGKATFYDMIHDECAQEWIKRIDKLPTHTTYVNAAGQIVYLSHAGFTPWRDENGKVIIPDTHELIWNRNHYFDDPLNDNNAVIVHGHTPIAYMIDEIRHDPTARIRELGPLWYSNNQKVCIDNGAFRSGVAYLLNLDTFEHHTFY